MSTRRQKENYNSEATSETVPLALRPTYAAIVTQIEAVCREHLNDEYAGLSRRLTAALARKRPSPLARGKPEIWACAIVYALGTVNFLFDKSQSPHMRADELCAAFGVSQSSASAKAKLIRDLFDMFQLSSVVSEISGVSSRAILAELVSDQLDPAQLEVLVHGQLRHKLPELEQALTGRVRAHHRFLLAHLDFLDEQLAAYSREVERLTAPFDELVELLDTIPGVARTTAELILAEVGADLSRFPTADHLASWAGLVPGNNESAGKRLSGKMRQGSQWLRAGLTQAAHAAARQKNNYLSAHYHRLAGRRGKKRATMAVAHSILVIAYHIIQRREPYKDLGSNYFDERQKVSTANRLTRRLEKLGYRITITPPPTPVAV